MKIYLNREPVSGPWGGGNKTLTMLVDYAKENEWEVVYSLDTGDIDLIFCFDPRPNSRGEWYQSFLNYKNENENVKIIQRVGDVGTHSKPDLTQLVIESVKFSDHVIFPSRWARDSIGFSGSNCSIIKNRPLNDFFLHRNSDMLIKDKKIKIVTHHWSTNPKKGFDMYEKLCEFCKDSEVYEFTYIGRIPDGFDSSLFDEYIEPKDVKYLCKKLPEYDIYLTASLEEAGANHVLEAIACGLPVIYHVNGGSIPEYCAEYGIQYIDYDTMISSLNKINNLYCFYKKSVLSYDESTEVTIKKYWELICNVV